MSTTDGIDRILETMKTQEQIEKLTGLVSQPSQQTVPVSTTSVFLDAARRNSINLQEQTSKLRADYNFHMGKADELIAQINELVTVQHTVVQQIHALEKAQIDG